ncbi:MAG: inositol monophosphatase [Candidatus Eisenbacteria bacterium]|nr:inositol monophosphatase [Candidatus Eisenbacteria bacterium]
MGDALTTAIEAARTAGGILAAGFERPMDVALKSPRELVTTMDRAAEDAIVRAIRDAFPGDAILAEEGSSKAGSTGRVWIVDPLDGTNNYAHGYPFFSVAIGVEEDGAPAAGVVYDPLRDEMFAAEAGGGATLNGRPLRVSDAGALADSLVATGFPYDRSERTDNNLANLNRVVLAARGIRRAGSAALDLAYVARGRLDGYWELGLRPWDVAAGGLVVREAGGAVTNFGGGAWDHRRGDIVASNGRIHAELLSHIR